MIFSFNMPQATGAVLAIGCSGPETTPFELDKKIF